MAFIHQKSEEPSERKKEEKKLEEKFQRVLKWLAREHMDLLKLKSDIGSAQQALRTVEVRTTNDWAKDDSTRKGVFYTEPYYNLFLRHVKDSFDWLDRKLRRDERRAYRDELRLIKLIKKTLLPKAKGNLLPHEYLKLEERLELEMRSILAEANRIHTTIAQSISAIRTATKKEDFALVEGHFAHLTEEVEAADTWVAAFVADSGAVREKILEAARAQIAEQERADAELGQNVDRVA